MYKALIKTMNCETWKTLEKKTGNSFRNLWPQKSICRLFRRDFGDNLRNPETTSKALQERFCGGASCEVLMVHLWRQVEKKKRFWR